MHAGTYAPGIKKGKKGSTHTGARADDLTDDVGHAGLVAQEGGQVARLGGIVAGERLYLTAMTAGTLAGQEPQRTVAGSLELAMTGEERGPWCKFESDKFQRL